MDNNSHFKIKPLVLLMLPMLSLSSAFADENKQNQNSDPISADSSNYPVPNASSYFDVVNITGPEDHRSEQGTMIPFKFIDAKIKSQDYKNAYKVGVDLLAGNSAVKSWFSGETVIDFSAPSLATNEAYNIGIKATAINGNDAFLYIRDKFTIDIDHANRENSNGIVVEGKNVTVDIVGEGSITNNAGSAIVAKQYEGGKIETATDSTIDINIIGTNSANPINLFVNSNIETGHAISAISNNNVNINTHNINIDNEGLMTHGIYAIITGNNGGTLNISHNGNISTKGQLAFAIIAKAMDNVNQTDININVSGGVLSTYGEQANAIHVETYRGDVKVNNAALINTYGKEANGIKIVARKDKLNQPSSIEIINTGMIETKVKDDNSASAIYISNIDSANITPPTDKYDGNITILNSGELRSTNHRTIYITSSGKVTIDNTGNMYGFLDINSPETIINNNGRFIMHNIDYLSDGSQSKKRIINTIGQGRNPNDDHQNKFNNGGLVAFYDQLFDGETNHAVFHVEEFINNEGGKIILNNTLNAANGIETIGNTLTINGDYISNGGALYLTTHLDDASSNNYEGTSDKLIVKGDVKLGERGATKLYITRSNSSSGGITGLNGIKLIHVDGEQPDESSFLLATPVAIGKYEYILARGLTRATNTHWYLTNRSSSDNYPDGGNGTGTNPNGNNGTDGNGSGTNTDGSNGGADNGAGANTGGSNGTAGNGSDTNTNGSNGAAGNGSDTNTNGSNGAAGNGSNPNTDGSNGAAGNGAGENTNNGNGANNNGSGANEGMDGNTPSTFLLLNPAMGSYLANQTAAIALQQQQLYDRLAATIYQNGSAFDYLLWLRSSYNHDKYRSLNGNANLRGHSYQLQLGGDIGVWRFNDGFLHGGLMAGLASNRHTNRSRLTGLESKGSVKGYQLGVYATFFANENINDGLYVDIWSQVGRYRNQVYGDAQPYTENYHSTVWTTSVETGYGLRFPHSESYDVVITPQAQISYNYYHSGDRIDGNDLSISNDKANGIMTRLGMRASLSSTSVTANSLEPFIELDWLYNSAKNQLTFDQENFSDETPRNRLAGSLGLKWRIKSQWAITGQLDGSLGNHHYENYGANIHVNYRF